MERKSSSAFRSVAYSALIRSLWVASTSTSSRSVGIPSSDLALVTAPRPDRMALSFRRSKADNPDSYASESSWSTILLTLSKAPPPFLRFLRT